MGKSLRGWLCINYVIFLYPQPPTFLFRAPSSPYCATLPSPFSPNSPPPGPAAHYVPLSPPSASWSHPSPGPVSSPQRLRRQASSQGPRADSCLMSLVATTPFYRAYSRSDVDPTGGVENTILFMVSNYCMSAIRNYWPPSNTSLLQ